MIEALIHINIAHSIFASILTITKRPLNVIDKILFVWLITISILFVWSLIRIHISDYVFNTWVYRTVIILAFPSFLFLYIKYLTSNKNQFQKRDLWHFGFFIAFLIAAIILVLVYPASADVSNFIRDRKVFPMLLGVVFILTFLMYGYYTIKLINRFVKQRDEYYSFRNGEISIEWIRRLVIFFYLTFGAITVLGVLGNFIPLFNDMSLPLNGCCTFFLYTVSFYGYKQKKLLTIPKIDREPGYSYKKSGLKEKDAKAYETSILFLMENEKPWLNAEVTISDISDQLKLPQHYVTQVINERLKKNFYTLVNEYRTNEVIRLFSEEKYKNWSLTSLAFEAGFNSRSSFNSFFKKYTGKTPSEYRKEITTAKT